MVLVSSDRAADVVSVKECSWSFSHLSGGHYFWVVNRWMFSSMLLQSCTSQMICIHSYELNRAARGPRERFCKMKRSHRRRRLLEAILKWAWFISLCVGPEKLASLSQPRTCKPQTSRDLFPRIFSCSRHLSSNRLPVTSILLAHGLIWCWFYNPQSRCAHHRLSISFNPLYTLTSVCIFSILFSTNFQRCWRGEFV